MAAVPVLRERVAMAATQLAVVAAEAATAEQAATLTAARLMVAMVATEFCSSLITTSGFWTYGIAGQRPAVMAARRSAEMAAWAATVALAATAATAATLMAATRLVAMAAAELRSTRIIRWTLFVS